MTNFYHHSDRNRGAFECCLRSKFTNRMRKLYCFICFLTIFQYNNQPMASKRSEFDLERKHVNDNPYSQERQPLFRFCVHRDVWILQNKHIRCSRGHMVLLSALEKCTHNILLMFTFRQTHTRIIMPRLNASKVFVTDRKTDLKWVLMSPFLWTCLEL